MEAQILKIQPELICSHSVSYGLLLKISQQTLQKFVGCMGCSKADDHTARYKYLIMFCFILSYIVYLSIDFIVIISDSISKNVVHISAVFRYLLFFFQSRLSLDINYSFQFLLFLEILPNLLKFQQQKKQSGHEVSCAVSLQAISLKEFRLK